MVHFLFNSRLLLSETDESGASGKYSVNKKVKGFLKGFEVSSEKTAVHHRFIAFLLESYRPF